LYSKLGALGVINFRLLFYLTLSVFWVWMYFRYSKVFGKIALGIWPVLYIFSMRLYDGLAHCVLADQLQAQGMVVLLLEYLLYVKNKRLDIKNMLCISFAVFLAVGNAFVSVFAIFIIVIGFTAHEIVEIFKEKKETTFKETLKKHLLQYGKLIVICLCPFIILIGVYIVKGCLYDAYYGIYLINRIYYPIYNTGYGSSIVGTMIGCFDMYFSYVINAVSNFSNLNYYTVFLITTMFVILTYGLIKKQYIAVVVIFCFTVFCGSRSYAQFHALPYYAVCLMLFSLLVQLIFNKLNNKKIKAMTKYKLILTVGLLIITFPFAYLHFDSLAEYKISKQELLFGPKTNLEKQIADLTVPGDEIYFCSLDTGVLINTQTFPATASPVCPWIYDAYKEKIFNDLETKKPNVIYYLPNYSVWGYKLNEFAPELSEYINTKYKLIDENIYIRK